MSDDVLVRVENVSKRFCRSLKRSLWYGLQDLGSEIGGRRHGGGSGLPQSSADVQLRPHEFWAVKDVSFELRRGECMGLIGRNGAGKTTLLRMLNGLIKPDTGEVEIHGSVGALIALGAGFNPLLTGRENIATNAAILGIKNLNRELEDEIISFAEIEEFIDSPVQSYSSGMAARLGFAIATSLRPQLLLVDEVLSVGDIKFRMKCYDRILGYIEGGGCAIIVSHNSVDLQRTCKLGIFMSKGQASVGSIEQAMASYSKSLYCTAIERKRIDSDFQIAISNSYNSGDVFARPGDSYSLLIKVFSRKYVQSCRLIVHLDSPESRLFSISSNSLLNIDLDENQQKSYVFRMPQLPLGQGTYRIIVDAYGKSIQDYLGISDSIYLEVRDSSNDPFGFGRYHSVVPPDYEFIQVS